jgi:hypothetical protein
VTPLCRTLERRLENLRRKSSDPIEQILGSFGDSAPNERRLRRSLSPFPSAIG